MSLKKKVSVIGPEPSSRSRCACTGSSAWTSVPRPGGLSIHMLAVERLDPVAEAAEPRAALGSAPPAPSSSISITDAPVEAVRAHARPSRRRRA